VNQLEQRLRALGGELEVPPTPDLAAAVASRLAPRRSRRRKPRRRTFAVALGLAVLLAGTALAVPPVRHAIERVFDLRGARVERVHQLPPVPPGASAAGSLGTPIPVARARTAASFRALLPPRAPDGAYLSRDVAGGRITLVEGKLLIMEFRGRAMPYVGKLIGPATRATRVRVNGGPGLYLDGAPHVLFFSDASGAVQTDTLRLAGNVLLWEQGPLVLRIEGAPTIAAALTLARSLR
jgi:hypothetical protein